MSCPSLPPPGDRRGSCLAARPAHVGAGSAPVRLVPFEGATNFRDLGGYPALGGKTTRWGLVYRSDGLHNLTEPDLALYRELGIETVYDLRSDAERTLHPDPFPNEHLPLLAEATIARSGGSGRDGALSDGERLLRDLYRGMLETGAPLLGRLLEGLADAERLPAVFHCTGGKDRTGVSAAVLLELLGVPRPVVLDDYELTGRYRTREHQSESYAGLIEAGLTPEAAAVVLGAPRWAMADALKVLDELGGVERYAVERAGLAPATIRRLRATLLV